MTIEGEVGYFHGSVSKQTSQPAGLGVFKNEERVHCGDFSDGAFADGNQGSLNKNAKVLRLTKQKSL